MKLDTEHLHHWMNAIRQSSDIKRTLDAFYRGQIRSKEWLIETLIQLNNENFKLDKFDVEIHGGWVGTLASLMFQSELPITYITSIDIDQSCEAIATEMNMLEFSQNKFKAITHNMCGYKQTAKIIINTSTEHLTQLDYDTWLSNTPNDSIIVTQGNNYNIPEHVRISKDINDFIQQCKLKVEFSGVLNLPLYERYMIVGYK